MIQLNDAGIDATASAKLLEYQNLVNGKATYAERVEEAKSKFKSYNRKGNATFDEVKKQLNVMCCGPERCNYCEDSKADEVEHIYPKDWYPDNCLVWGNYCYACGTCNGPKNNKYAIFKREDDTYLELIREKDATIVAPEDGDAVLINPRDENPLKFLFLDINRSFFFVPVEANTAEKDNVRATYTIKILGLNSRSYLVKARKLAFSNFRSRLSDYITHRDLGVDQNQLDEMIKNIKEEHHQTVWREMIRQRDHHPVLQNLFNRAPEATGWI